MSVKKRLTLVLISLLVASLPSCDSVTVGRTPATFFTDVTALIEVERYEDAIDLLRTTDIDGLMQHKLSTGDHRYLAVAGYTVMLPGLPEQTKLDVRYWIFPGTSDFVRHMGWEKATWKFAEKYNQRLYDRLRQ